jgi:Cro/C1-type helix-turn-helix DNA-binding protein
VDGRTLNALCGALGVGPGELLEYVPDRTLTTQMLVKIGLQKYVEFRVEQHEEVLRGRI